MGRLSPWHRRPTRRCRATSHARGTRRTRRSGTCSRRSAGEGAEQYLGWIRTRGRDDHDIPSMGRSRPRTTCVAFDEASVAGAPGRPWSRGINVVGYVTAVSASARSARVLASMLDAAGVPKFGRCEPQRPSSEQSLAFDSGRLERRALRREPALRQRRPHRTPRPAARPGVLRRPAHDRRLVLGGRGLPALDDAGLRVRRRGMGRERLRARSHRAGGTEAGAQVPAPRRRAGRAGPASRDPSSGCPRTGSCSSSSTTSSAPPNGRTQSG